MCIIKFTIVIFMSKQVSNDCNKGFSYNYILMDSCGIEPYTGLNPFKKIIIGIKPALGNHESNFKKVNSIQCGLNSMGTILKIYLPF